MMRMRRKAYSKFFKERALKPHAEGDYELFLIHSDEIQNIADEENQRDYE